MALKAFLNWKICCCSSLIGSSKSLIYQLASEVIDVSYCRPDCLKLTVIGGEWQTVRPITYQALLTKPLLLLHWNKPLKVVRESH